MDKLISLLRRRKQARAQVDKLFIKRPKDTHQVAIPLK